MIELLHIDCMEYMATLPDKAFDLAVIDPPYGIGESSKNRNGISKNIDKRNGRVTFIKSDNLIKEWDKHPPNLKYFDELKRVSKNQIIWGANHFIQNIPNANSSCWIIWDKENGENDFADCEMAWTSFGTAVRRFKFRWAGMLQGNMKDKEIRMHPTQKPVKLYKWILHNYAKPGDRILDTHLGSGSSAIAAHYGGFDFVGCELDKEYYDAACKRFKEQTKQLTLL